MSKSHKSIIVKKHTGNMEIAEHGAVVLPLSGTLTAICACDEFSLSDNHFIIIPCGEPCKLYSIGEYVVIQCESRALSGNPALAELMPTLSEPMIITADSVSRGLIDEMRELFETASPTTETRVYIKLLELFVYVAEHRNGYTHAERNSAKLRLALNYIDNNYMNDLSLDEIASASGYSKFHLSRLFRKFSGMSLTDYVKHMRVREAVKLLEQTDITITEAAMKSGFAGISTFNHAFKDIHGCSPREYRKRKK